MIKFFKTKEPYGEFSNFSRYAVQLDGYSWPTAEHYFQAQKHINTPFYHEIRQAKTPRIAADLGRDRAHPLRPDWEQVKDDVMRKCVLNKFQLHYNLRRILIETGNEEIIEDSPYDAYWGRGPNGDGKNKLGKILMETREYLKEHAHCTTCGTKHAIKEPCPPEAFYLISCKCGDESLIPGDALFGYGPGMYCGQCGKDTDWQEPKTPTIEDMKRHWTDYGNPIQEKL